MRSSTPSRLGELILIGALGGVLSGAFGIGGGIIMIPLIVRFLKYDHRRAAATSLAAVFPAAVAGTIGYGIEGNVAWEAGLVIAAGGAIGSLGGTWTLQRISPRTAQIAFLIALGAVIVISLIEIPPREATVELSLLTGAISFVIGIGMGFASGLLGIGGGVIAIPLMIIVLGASDVLAKGTSLVAIVPTALVGTINNARNGLVDVREGFTIGIAAAIASYPGVWLAHLVSPLAATIGFVCLVVAIIIITLVTGRARTRPDDAE